MGWAILCTRKRHPGDWINIKMLSYQYRKYHCGDKTILRPSYLHNGISYTGETTSLYWIGALSYYFAGSGVSIVSIFEKQGKSEGFESCDRPIVRKRPIRVKSGDVLSRVTLKFDGWLWKTIGHLSFAVSSFVQHFITISEFKLELLSRNAQFR